MMVSGILKSSLVELKSKFNAEFRRVSLYPEQVNSFAHFQKFLVYLHHLENIDYEVDIFYNDPTDKELLPINNDMNYQKALTTARPLLRVFLQAKGSNALVVSSKAVSQSSSTINSKEARPIISKPADFRQIAAIIDVNVIPETLRRVKLLKHTLDKPLGFFIRDGISIRLTNKGLEKAPGIFISRLVPGGLAEMTGLLSVNDEVLEVNGIDVYGKSLDQVTDMMVANSSNLIITVKPANQRNNPVPRTATGGVSQSRFSLMSGDDEEDEVIDLLHPADNKSIAHSRQNLAASKQSINQSKQNLAQSKQSLYDL